MSAYIVDPDTVDLIVTAGLHGMGASAYYNGRTVNLRDWDPGTVWVGGGDLIATILHRANVHSVNYRYNESTPAPEVTYRKVCGLGTVVPWGAVFGALDCYEYQSCEDSQTWETSEAKAICEAIRRHVGRILADESGHPWGFTRDEAPANV